MDRIICRKCLLKDLEKDEYFKNVYDYIQSIDEDLKVSDDIYEQRLNKCKQCENLINAMCKRCGCFVEMRAIIKNKFCPDVKPKW